jgi:Na+:H+ antiporter, NhaA family
MKVTKLFIDFFNSEKSSGVILIFCTVASLVLTNVLPAYGDFWHIQFAGHHLTHWVNDGLMVIFFLLVGLELEREVYIGELSNLRGALLPVIAAMGGMIVPGLIYYLFNVNSGFTHGFGIPMATDIAFALAVLSLLGNRVPTSLKIFLTALAVIDDLGAILVIAIFYTSDLHWLNLGIAMGIFAFLLILNRLKVHTLWPYMISGIVMWYFMLHSGVHATITGVLLAFAIPFGTGDEKSPSYDLQHYLHRIVGFFILPVFALANTSIHLESDTFFALGGSVSLGIMAGLFIGKPIGIFLFSYGSVKLNLSTLPSDIQWRYIFGAGILGGIGFTMSIFISLLAFENPHVIDQSKISVMIISLFAGIVGFLYLKRALRTEPAIGE